jgi:hypothetical protein
MGAKQELIHTADEEYGRLRTAIDGLDEAQMNRPWLGVWGVREILAHIAGWHREMVPALERIARGEPPYPDGTYDDFDRWNARFVEARHGVKATDILREVDATHRDLLAAVSRLSDEHFGGGQAVPGLVDGVGPGHYREHAEQIRQWRRRESL